jgi:hypothetical protein
MVSWCVKEMIYVKCETAIISMRVFRDNDFFWGSKQMYQAVVKFNRWIILMTLSLVLLHKKILINLALTCCEMNAARRKALKLPNKELFADL